MPWSPISSGIQPSAGPNLDELNYITRRGITPNYVVQIWQASPTFAWLLNASRRASGGVTQYNEPVGVNQLTQGSWMSYGGTFNMPPIIAGTLMAQWNLKLLGVPIPYLYTEAWIQQDQAVIDILDVRCNDAVMNTRNMLSLSLFNNTTNPQAVIGLPAAVDNGSTGSTYAGIPYDYSAYDPVTQTSGNPWQAFVYNNSTATTPTRGSCINMITGVVKRGLGESPNFAVMGPATWAQLAQDFISAENFYISPGTGFDTYETLPRSSFQAYQIGGVLHYFDPYCPEGTIYYLNTNYIFFMFHEQVVFNFTGFYSLIPTAALQWVGVYLSMLELVNTKPRTQGKTTNWSYVSSL